MSTALDPPAAAAPRSDPARDFDFLIGRFDGNDAHFDGPDEFHGQPITVRCHWARLGTDRARWQQLFSTDSGAHWELNWVMEMRRLPPADGSPTEV